MRGFLQGTSTVLMLAFWIAAMLALNLWCDSTAPTSCNPRVSVDRCEPDLGNYLR